MLRSWNTNIGRVKSQYTSPAFPLLGPDGFGRGTSRGTSFTMIHPRLFHTLSQCYVVEVQTLVELNPNILVRRFQRMYIVSLSSQCNCLKLRRDVGSRIACIQGLIWDIRSEIPTIICPQLLFPLKYYINVKNNGKRATTMIGCDVSNSVNSSLHYEKVKNSKNLILSSSLSQEI